MTLDPNTVSRDAPVTDAALRQLLGYNLKRAFLAIRSDLDRLLKEMDLRIISYSALTVIVENPGLRQAKLAEALSIEQANLVSVVAELEQRKLVERERTPNDRRAYALFATPAGRRLQQMAYEADLDHEAALMADLTQAERAGLIAALRKVERAAHQTTE